MESQRTQKVFIRKTKRGTVQKIVREHYLRDDLWCGSQLCTSCDHDQPILDSKPESISSVCQGPHYIFPDYTVVLEQSDFLEADAIKNAVILSTVLQEVRNKSGPGYKRIRELLSLPSKRFYAFVNEHHWETFVKREPGETEEERNARAVQYACKWYQNHLSNMRKSSDDTVKAILLTNSEILRDSARSNGVDCFTVKEYAEAAAKFPELMDKLSQSGKSYVAGEKNIFPPHLTPAALKEKLKKGDLRQGNFSASNENYLEGFVNVEGMDKPVLIQGMANLNRAVQGDIVAVEIFPEKQWVGPSGVVMEDPDDDKGDAVDDAEVAVPEHSADIQPTGRIVGVIRRKWRQYCGILQPSAIKEHTKHLFVPAERKIPKIRIETRQAQTLQGQRIVVQMDEWPRYSRYPLGHFVRALGKIGDKNTENEVLLLEHDIPHSKFSENVLKCLPKMPWGITDEEVAKRRDLRDIIICSVDPPGCTDIDDALHCRVLENGNYEVGVHIADVSHFIRPSTAIDDEAAIRGTSVYLVDRRIDMVPELLSSNLCSLRGGEIRYAFSVTWEVTPQAEFIKEDYFKSIIKSSAALTYEQAQLRIDDPNLNDDLTLGLRRLNNLAKIMRKQRADAGALVLASPEVRFQVDSETHDPIEVQVKQLRETNSMVEEWMLKANMTVAAKIFETFPECACLRRHPAPPVPNFDPVVKATAPKGFKMDVSTNGNLAASLDKAVVFDNPFYNTMLRILTTRCMMQAVYFASGTLDYKEFYHYGLAAPIYTHFTSPIRRYADVIVHRLLAAAIGADATYPALTDKRRTQIICNNINYRHKMAQYAGRASVNLHTRMFFKGRISQEDGYVLQVRKNALQILVPKYGLEATLFVQGKHIDPEKVKFVYDEAEPSQTCGKIKFSTFDKVVIQISIDESNVQHEKLVVRLVYPKVPDFSVDPLPASA